MGYDCSCDYDLPTFITVKTLKARKPHCCCECHAQIEPGETYEYVAGKWEWGLDIFHICALCVELREWARISVPCFCWAYSNLHDDVREMVSEVRRDVPGFVFEWGRRIVKIERRRYGEHWPQKYLRHRPRRSAAEIATGARS